MEKALFDKLQNRQMGDNTNSGVSKIVHGTGIEHLNDRDLNIEEQSQQDKKHSEVNGNNLQQKMGAGILKNLQDAEQEKKNS